MAADSAGQSDLTAQMQRHVRQTTQILALALVLWSIMTACGLPLPAPKRLLGPGSVPLQTEPDTTNLRVALTTREEVRRAFAAVYVWEGDRVFIGRWARSRLASQFGREWAARNVLIAFDANGRVEQFKVCGDGEFVKILPAYLASESIRVDELALRTNCPAPLEQIEKLSPIRPVHEDPAGLVWVTVEMRNGSRQECGNDIPTVIMLLQYLSQKK
jgi:hypothetical protein